MDIRCKEEEACVCVCVHAYVSLCKNVCVHVYVCIVHLCTHYWHINISDVSLIVPGTLCVLAYVYTHTHIGPRGVGYLHTHIGPRGVGYLHTHIGPRGVGYLHTHIGPRGVGYLHTHIGPRGVGYLHTHIGPRGVGYLHTHIDPRGMGYLHTYIGPRGVGYLHTHIGPRGMGYLHTHIGPRTLLHLSTHCICRVGVWNVYLHLIRQLTQWEMSPCIQMSSDPLVPIISFYSHWGDSKRSALTESHCVSIWSCQCMQRWRYWQLDACINGHCVCGFITCAP